MTPTPATWRALLPLQVAHAFVRTLTLDYLTPREAVEVRRRNATPAYGPGTCASHDFCDANMAMHDAFCVTIGRDPLDGANDGTVYAMTADDCVLWGRAWDIAKRDHLTEARR